MFMLWATYWTRFLLWYVHGESVNFQILRIFSIDHDKRLKSNFSTVSGSDYDAIEQSMKRIVKEEQPFERLEISKEDLLRLFGVSFSYEMMYQSRSTVF